MFRGKESSSVCKECSSEAPGLIMQCDESLENDAAKCLLSLHPEDFSGCSWTLMLLIGVSKEEEEEEEEEPFLTSSAVFGVSAAFSLSSSIRVRMIFSFTLCMVFLRC